MFLQGNTKAKNKIYGTADVNKILYEYHRPQKLREKCPNTELFLARVFLYSD